LGEIIVDISDGVRENHSKAGHDYQIIKQPKTYEQQVELIILFDGDAVLFLCGFTIGRPEIYSKRDI
jgi:hypothetical protein